APSTIANPTGRCSHPFATSTKYADAYAVSVTTQNNPRCTHRVSRSHPKNHSPRNVDSTKNATIVSRASGAPNTPPVTRVIPAQFNPNWNSITSPVTIPTA